MLLLIPFPSTKVKEKFKLDYEIGKFHCIENEIEIDDNDLFDAFLSIVKSESSKTFSIIALGSDDEYSEFNFFSSFFLISFFLPNYNNRFFFLYKQS